MVPPAPGSPPSAARSATDAPGAPGVFALPDDLTGEDVLERLAAAFVVRVCPTEPVDRTLLDTFDARLGRAGGLLWLERGPESSSLQWRRGTLVTPPVPLRNGSAPAFSDELPTDRLRDEIGPLADPRRLVPTVRLVGERRALDILDRVRKTVARVVLDDRLAHGPGRRDGRRLPARLRLIPVRGYDEHRLVAAFLEQELGLTPIEDDEIEAALRCVGREPGLDPCTPRPLLTPDLPAEEAVRAVLKELLRVIRENEHGVDDARDIEFLHDFRVAVRQTRSVLGQIRDVLPDKIVERHSEEFRWLGQRTGPARDLDVLTEQWPELLSGLEPELAADLAPVRALLDAQRGAARRRLTKDLGSARYRRLVEGWAQALIRPVKGPERAELTIGEVASAAIERAWRRVRRKGRRLQDDAPAEHFHDLRIAAKKLRYLIALFGSLGGSGRTQEAVAVLKRMQNRLGDFNDACQQADWLRAAARELRDDSRVEVGTLLAAGRLLERIEAGGARLQVASREAFAVFDQPQHRKLFTGLLKRGGKHR